MQGLLFTLDFLKRLFVKVEAKQDEARMNTFVY